MTRRTGIILFSVLLCILVICLLATYGSPKPSPNETTASSTEESIESVVERYNKQVALYNEAVAAYNDSIQLVADANVILDQEIAIAQTALVSEDIPFDPQTALDLEQAIQTAYEAKIAVPEALPIRDVAVIPEDASSEEIGELRASVAAELDALKSVEVPMPLTAPDYTSVIASLLEARNTYQHSVEIQKQVTAPDDNFVLERLKQIDTVVSLGTVTQSNDPNGLLGKEGGYIGCIYFSDSRVDKTKLNLKPSQYDVISMGTVGGGAIEIYATIEEAEARNSYLATYDGTDLDPGSHVVVGTMVVRTSSMLTDEQQTELTNQIITIMTALEASENLH